MKAYLLITKCIYLQSIFAKCTPLACLLLKLAVGKSHINHNSLQYVALDCVKNVSHEVCVSSCCFKCSYLPLSGGFILRLKPMPNVVPEKIEIRNDANVKAHNYESML